MTEQHLPQEVTKQSFRCKTWDYMMKNELVNFPFNLHKRIPNFKGASEAAQRLSELQEFKTARVIKINPDKPQESVRFLALEAEKEILVPIPRLRSGLFLHVGPVGDIPKNELRTLASMHGLKQVGTSVGIDSNIKVDLVVLGSVCVDRRGYRLGKGEGFADLEFAIMMKMGAVTENTIIVTTVHDCQITDDLPSELFREYDVPVDIIITPTQSIVVESKLPRPKGILWEMLTHRKLKSMQILQQLKEMDEKIGITVTLKEVDSDLEVDQQYKNQYSKNLPMRSKKKKHFEERGRASDTNVSSVAVESTEIDNKARLSRKPRYRKSKGTSNDNAVDNEEKPESGNKMKSGRRGFFRHRMHSQVEFSLKLSNISPDVRVRDLKNALLERGIKPSEITWQGYDGICYLHFGKMRNAGSPQNEPVQVDSIVANLQRFRIRESLDEENNFIIVEPAEPISRIEVTDISSV